MANRSLMSGTLVLSVAVSLSASEGPTTNVNLTKTDGTIESAWVLQIPTGPSDFFSVRFVLDGTVPPALRHGTLQGAYPMHDDTPLVGLYASKSGSTTTPDLSQPISQAIHPPVTHGYVDLPDVDLGAVPDGTYHLVMQFPPGDSGLVGVGADSNGTGGGGGDFNPIDSSFYSFDGYHTPAVAFTFGDFLLDLVVHPRAADGAYLSTTNDATLTIGDYEKIKVNKQRNTGIAIFGPNPSNDVWLLFLSTATGLPQFAMGPVLTMVADADGDWARLGAKFPTGFSGMTLSFVAGWANLPLGQMGLSNVIELHVP